MEIKRIDFLDGFRGVAILLVILFHAYARWPKIVPYGDKFSAIVLFKYGYLGVELFFLISGFVILMSLEKSKNLSTFIYKRWIRLFPAMLIATILVYATASLLSERPSGNSALKSIIPGLLFIEPSWLKILVGFKIEALEGAFWSLFVEVKFYFIFGLLYFLFSRNRAILGLLILYLFCLISNYFHLKYFETICSYLSLIYFSWFAIGALAYLYYSTKSLHYLLISIAVGCFQIYANFVQNISLGIYVLLIVLLFFLPIYFEKCRTITNNKFLIWFGFISYPLYLIHENAMISLIIKVNKLFPSIPDYLLLVIPVAFLSAIAYLIALKIEPLVRSFIDKKCKSVKGRYMQLRQS